MLHSLATRLGLAAAVAALAFGFAAAPVSFEVANGTLAVKEAKAFAKHGADDPAGHNAGDDKGGNANGGKSGKGRGGKDDGANHK